MPRLRKINHLGDRILEYEREELEKLYLQEGLSQEEAAEKANKLYDELKLLNNRTKNVWRRARNR